MAYEINYKDERFQDVEADKKAAISDLEKTYSGMINESDGFYKAQIDASKEWEKKQTQLQNEKTDFAIEKIEQQKAQEKKDYTKEQSGAYVDWQKQSNEFGAEAEARAAQGMANTGFSESSQVSMYNTYQNRVATAREAYSRAVLDFNNAITEARLQNNSALAEIAFNSQKERLELALQGFQYKNTLVLDKANKKTELEQMYHERWQDVLNQINTENSLAEQIRQFNESLALDKAQFAEQQRQFNYENKLGEFAETGSSSGSSSGSGTISKRTAQANLSNKDRKEQEEKAQLNSGSGDMPSDTKKSILALGQGPISEKNLASQVNSGKVTMSTSTKTGNTIFSYSGLKKYQ